MLKKIGAKPNGLGGQIMTFVKEKRSQTNFQKAKFEEFGSEEANVATLCEGFGELIFQIWHIVCKKYAKP